jgi:amino acid adenylation domain-containing protein
MPKLELPGVEIDFLDLDRGVSQFDLTLMMSKSKGQCHATVEYSDDLFNAATVSRMFQSFQILLDEVTAHPDKPISRLRLITKEEQRRLLYKMNETKRDFPSEKCLHELFEAQVKQTPDSVAVIHDNDSITYSDLNRRANILARHLKTLGVGPGTRVGILMERSIEIVEALFGVLKSGGTYVPIHTCFPTDRVQFICTDANVKVLLTNVDHISSDIENIKVVNLNDKLSDECSNMKADITPDSLAYIIYTSGSTGNPKGVMVQHSSLVNFLWSMRQRPGITKDNILLSVTPISFDIAALELFLPLIVGATVVIASREMTSNPIQIGEAIKRYQVNMMQATPATWQLLIETGWKGEPGLKAFCGGEALTRKLADQLLNRVDNLWNMYGPTETTVWSSVNLIQKGDSTITIGEPIDNTQLYVLDGGLQPVPVGVVGELHIGGEGLAQGYHNQGHLTDEKFIRDCFSTNINARLYKTGDRARYLANGSIEILGRMDDQVKINGNRIELGEIGSILLQHPSVRDGIVMTGTESGGEKRLVAYFVPKHNLPLSITELREFFGKKLPPYMIPDFFISMDSLPLTPNGKIDRKSLPSPQNVFQHSGYMGPRNETEKMLVEIWKNVLHLEKVGIHDNFFDLGGASMQSLQVVTKANMYGLQLSIENLFEHQTIAELAAHLKVVTIAGNSSV